MNLGRKIGGFSAAKPKKSEIYTQQEFYCEMCGRTTKEETILEEKLGKYLCEGCRKEYERKNDGKRS